MFAAVFSTFMLGVLDRRLPGVIGAFIIGVLALAKWSVYSLRCLSLCSPMSARSSRSGRGRFRPWRFSPRSWRASPSRASRSRAFPGTSETGTISPAFFSVAVNSPRTVLPLGGQLAFVACSGALAAVLFADARAGWVSRLQRGYTWLTPLLLGAGWLWVFPALYHASRTVRADGGHFYIGWNALLVSLPITLLVAGSSVAAGMPACGGAKSLLRLRRVPCSCLSPNIRHCGVTHVLQ